jgi:hypothetical protein
MRKLLIVALLALSSVAYIAAQGWTGPSEYVTSVSATATNTQVLFGFNASTIVVANDGANTVYLTLASGTSTTSKFPIKNGESFNIRLDSSPAKGLGLICASTETATVRVGAWR